MTCVMCAPIARRGLTGRVSAGSLTSWTPSGSAGGGCGEPARRAGDGPRCSLAAGAAGCSAGREQLVVLIRSAASEPVRHRYNPGGNRRVNRALHLMAVTQLRCEPRAQALYENARARGHTKKEARRILKRHLSDVVYRRMIRDLAERAADRPLLAA